MTSTDTSSIEALLAEMIPGARVSAESEDAKDGAAPTTTVSARAGMRVGVDVKVTGEKAVVEWSTTLGLIAMLVILVTAGVLMYLFGESMLRAMGLIADAGSVSITLTLFYAIPLVIFLIPLGIAWAVIGSRVAPKDNALLARIVERLKALGLDASVDGENDGDS